MYTKAAVGVGATTSGALAMTGINTTVYIVSAMLFVLVGALLLRGAYLRRQRG
jgi:hypothetical protein